MPHPSPPAVQFHSVDNLSRRFDVRSVHHVTCPFCRKVCMHVDEYRGKQKHELIEELLELHSKRSATTYFCIQEGLVTIPCRIRCTNSELKRLQGRICDCIVDRKELATMRGGNQRNNNESCLREMKGQRSTNRKSRVLSPAAGMKEKRPNRI